MAIETLTVVDVSGLGLPREIEEELADHYEISNDSYHRYYPDSEWKYIDAKTKAIVNAALLNAGVVFPDVMYRPAGHPDGYYNFKVLLHFSW